MPPPGLKCNSPPLQGGYEATSWKYGSIPDWPEPKYELERRTAWRLGESDAAAVQGTHEAAYLLGQSCFYSG